MGAPLDLLSLTPRAALLSLRVPAPLVALEAFLRLPLPGDALLWQGRGEAPVAARGSVDRLELAPGEPLAALAARAAWAAEVDRRTLPAGDASRALPAADAGAPVAGPPASEPGLRWYGGAAFAAGAPGPDWQGFGPASFTLPRLAYEPEASGAWLRLNLRADEAGDLARWLDLLEQARRGLGQPPAPGAAPRGRVLADRAAAYEQTVAAALAAIAAGSCEKIVAARALRVAIGGDALTVLERLADEGLVRFALGRGDALFFGATPERLVRLAGRAVATEALAGSIAADDEQAGAHLLASDKDAREHRVVVETIVTALGPLCERLAPAPSPALRRLRHLLHLVTPIEGRTAGSRHVLELVAALHPTPAVGGLPRAAACAWLERHEGLDRGWYAGPVGWFDVQGQGSFAVALRSALRRGDEASVFVGAGVVRGSTPAGERRETDLKARAMLGALGVEPS